MVPGVAVPHLETCSAEAVLHQLRAFVAAADAMSSTREVSACYLACMRGSNCKNHLSKATYDAQPTFTATFLSLRMNAVHWEADIVH
jgi:hypothetical protein